MERTGALALVGGTIYASPADKPIRDGVVLICDGKIAAVGIRSELPVPPDVEALDCSNCTITAGFWNSHVHFFERKWADAGSIPAPELAHQLQEMLTRYGFTSVFDLSSLWKNTRKLRERIESGEVAGPRMRSTGEGLVSPGALPPEQVTGMMGVMKTPLPEVADPAQAVAAAKTLLEDGVDGVKLFIKGGPSHAAFSAETIRAVGEEAHRRGKPVFVHPTSGDDVLKAIANGVDIIAHTTPHSGPWDRAILSDLRERRTALTPTLTLWKYFMRHDRVSSQENITDTALKQLQSWIAAGGTVLFGTDLGAVDYDPAEEYALMALGGMNFTAILASLTTAPAEQFGETERLGRIAAGLQADLTILRGDPLADIRALADVRQTLRDGRIMFG
jgi:imidazolonepropionase-like amidohydrolase